MSVYVQSLVWKCAAIRQATELVVALALADEANDDGLAIVSVKDIMGKTRLSRRGFQTRVRTLGYVSIQESAGPSGENVYELDLSWLIAHRRQQRSINYSLPLKHSRKRRKGGAAGAPPPVQQVRPSGVQQVHPPRAAGAPPIPHIEKTTTTTGPAALDGVVGGRGNVDNGSDYLYPFDRARTELLIKAGVFNAPAGEATRLHSPERIDKELERLRRTLALPGKVPNPGALLLQWLRGPDRDLADWPPPSYPSLFPVGGDGAADPPTGEVLP